jgi:predicted DNA-binding ribbon-helix-helix protein
MRDHPTSQHPESQSGDPSAMRKRSVLIAGHSTSVSLEAAFWEALRAVAAERGCSINALVEAVDRDRTGNLSSALRVFVLRCRATTTSPCAHAREAPMCGL